MPKEDTNMHSASEYARLYLLRVGADSTKAGGGFYSPIFEDRSYLFVPIPEWDVIQDKAVTYGSYKWNGRSVLEYIPPTIASRPSKMQPVHNDPEFGTFTYGSPRYARGNGTEKNYNKLKSMNPGDILVFYAAFKNVSPSRNDPVYGLYCFSYLVVHKAVPYQDPASIVEGNKQLVVGNHHFIHNYHNQVIIVGDRAKSRVLNKAVLLSTTQDRRGSNYYPCQSMIQKLGGYDKSLNLSSLRQMPSSPNIALSFKEYLDRLGLD